MDDGLDPLRVMYGQADGRRCFCLDKNKCIFKKCKNKYALRKSIMKGFSVFKSYTQSENTND